MAEYMKQEVYDIIGETGLISGAPESDLGDYVQIVD